MAGFRKATAKQAALKIGIYGPSGSGKTFSSLLVAEGLAKVAKKRVAVVDTENGTDFYSQPVKTRKFHPEPFDFDALYTRSLTEVLKSVKDLDPKEYAVVVIDSITHLWEAARAAYTGGTTKVGTIPMYAWGKIKQPYKELITFLLNSPMHVLFCGRQGQEYATDEESGELKHVGVKMKAEGETPYEPHILIRMEAIRPSKRGELAVPTAYIEKDRTGVLAGQTIAWPNFEKIAQPILGLLGKEQAQIPDDELTAAQDAEALREEEQLKHKRSGKTRDEFKARFLLAKDKSQVEAVAKKITPAVKKSMLAEDVQILKQCYLDALERIDFEDEEQQVTRSQWANAVAHEQERVDRRLEELRGSEDEGAIIANDDMNE